MRTGLSTVRRLGRALGLMAAAAAIAACSAVYRNHGYIPSDAELARVEVGVSTRSDVAAEIGRPTSSGLLADSGWYYVGSRFKHLGARPPEEIDRQVVAITFTPEGVVENVERFGLEQGQIVPITRRVTESNVKGIGLLRQLFANFGRLNANQLGVN